MINIAKLIAGIVTISFFGSAQATERGTPLRTVNNAPIFLYYNDSVISRDGRFRLVFQTDGNLVLYQGQSPLWSSETTPTYFSISQPGGPNTNGPFVTNMVNYACVAVFQGDGNLVVYGATGLASSGNPCQRTSFASMKPFWNSRTSAYPGSTLEVQDDGNLVIYDTSSIARWNSRTCCR